MPYVAGIDSSTQSCKVQIRDAATGRLVRSGSAPHPPGTEVHPDAWWDALQSAVREAGGLGDVAAFSIGGQQHGMVCLDSNGEVVRPALLWNDTRSSQDAEDLMREAGGGDLEAGKRFFARHVGMTLVASFTITKLRWLARNEPDNARRVAAVCLPHDWLTWKLLGQPNGIAGITTDRSDASGTGYWSTLTGEYSHELVEHALGHLPMLPKVLPAHFAQAGTGGMVAGVGAGDNAAAALGVGASIGDAVVSLGTSGVVSAVWPDPVQDPTGIVAGFADATGNYLPLVCTLNAAGVFDQTARMLGCSAQEWSSLALAAGPGAEGVTMIPYLAGERTPNLPDAQGSISGLTVSNYTRENIARASLEGVLCGLVDGVAALHGQGIEPERIILVGGGARSAAARSVAPTVFKQPVFAPDPDEYVARGMAVQAAWALTRNFPNWLTGHGAPLEGTYDPAVHEKYAQHRDRVVDRWS